LGGPLSVARSLVGTYGRAMSEPVYGISADGVPITEEVIERVVAEAERGYAPEALVRRESVPLDDAKGSSACR
jgi:hypothetical protein